jgi:predicted enzyme related to lactoylglutathione lyase
MLKPIEVAFACYAVTDMPRSRAFYEGVLGLKPATVSGGGNFVEYELGPHTMAIGCGAGWKPSPDGCSVALEVEDFDAAIAHLRDKAVKFRMEPLQAPTCRMAMIFDPDGNSICIHKRNSSGVEG